MYYFCIVIQPANIIKIYTMSKRCQIICFESLNSTNDWARNSIDMLGERSIIIAQNQTAGRGQGDHSWHSRPGENLLCSIVLKGLHLSAKDGQAISEITALSLVEIMKTNGIDARIKLPNDIYVNGNKIAGLLIEHAIRGNEISWSIVGLGLNVNQTEFPKELPNPTSMKMLGAGHKDINDILNQVQDTFFIKLEEYIKNGDRESLHNEFISKVLSSQQS